MKRVIIAALFCCVALPLQAQRQQSSQIGIHLRLIVMDTVNPATNELRYSYPAGFLIGDNNGRLLIRSDSAGADTLRINVNNITFAEEYMGTHRHLRLGTVSGLVVGGVGGYLSGKAKGPDQPSCFILGGVQYCQGTVPGTPDTRVKNAGIFAAVGTLAGAGIGYAIRTQVWRRLDQRMLHSL